MANEAYYSGEYYRQQRRLMIDGDPRALICICVDVSQSMEEWWIEKGGIATYTGSGFADGHNVNYFNLRDIKPGFAHYKKMNQLNSTLESLLFELKNDKELANKVAVSIVTYSRFADVKLDFIDCEDLDISDCKCKVDKAETAMSEGIRTSIAQIDEMQQALRDADNDSYTPILVFMTDGAPTDDPRQEFALIRKRIENEELFVFPLGIGEGADMALLRNMFPIGGAPFDFTSRYKMVTPKDYASVFQEIKDHIQMKNRVMVSEGNSKQSDPIINNDDVMNNQMGESFIDDLLNLI